MFYVEQDNVLSIDECNRLIALGHAQGFEAAKVQFYGEQRTLNNIRNNSRIEFDDLHLSQSLTILLKEQLGKLFPDKMGEHVFEKAGSHFRMYAYEPGQYFKPHKDGHDKRDGLESLVTVLFYLNDTEGGETVLMPDGFKNKDTWVTIAPTTGKVLMFAHDVFHEGKEVTQGYKYVLRTDLYYVVNNTK